ncbi:MAG: hypothetical protein ACJATI_001985 [Halioglobus sp.]|jgi:hypothetical protein
MNFSASPLIVMRPLHLLVESRKKKYRIYYLHELYGEYYTKKLKHIRAADSFNEALEDAILVNADNQLFPAIPRIYMRRANNYVKLDSIKLAFTVYQSGLCHFDKHLEGDWSMNPSIQISNSATVGLELLTAKAKICKKFIQSDIRHYLFDYSKRNISCRYESCR